MGRMKKRLSKRKTLKLKYKIERKVRDHTRKQRKADKGKKKSKIAGPLDIPNSYPFKERELADLEAQRLKVEAEKERQKEARRKEREKRRQAQQAQHESLAKSMKGGRLNQEDIDNAVERADEFNAQAKVAQADEDVLREKKPMSQRAHIRELKKMVEMSDVLLEILDARDPLGCRCRALELAIEADVNKRLILVLNKIDLIPRDAAQKWLTYLRQSFPTIAFKATTQQKGRVQQSKVSAGAANDTLLASSECLGANTLVQLLKNYSRSHDMKKSIVVGVFGYPNVGKSSLINSLKRSKAVGVSPCPGFTRSVAEIHLDKHIKLVDCPGVVFDFAPEEATSSSGDTGGLISKGAVNAATILRNAVGVDKVEDPVKVVEAIIARCSVLGIARHYRIATFNTVVDFLLQIAQIRGKLGKGGKPDIDGAARCVLFDWNTGKIPFYTLPPTQTAPTSTKKKTDDSAPAMDAEDTVVVQSWAKEFDIDALLAEEETELNNAQFQTAARCVTMEAGKYGGMLTEENAAESDSDSSMGDDAGDDDDDDDDDDNDDDDVDDDDQ